MAYGSALVLSVFLSLLLIGASVARSAPSRPWKLLIDTDAGADDAAAILFVLQAEKLLNESFETVAITCTYGNTKLENVEINVLKTITVANRTDIPVYTGAMRPLISEFQHSDYFGEDGLGDFNFQQPIGGQINRSVHAASAMVDLASRYPGELVILTLGPLTNMATAVALDSTFQSKLKAIYTLGASVSGVGNLEPNIEFNFGLDPEANLITLNSTAKPITLVPWETVLKTDIPRSWREEVLGRLDTEIVKFLNSAERISLPKGETWQPSDAIAAAVMIYQELILRVDTTNVTPVISGLARGSVLVDYTNLTRKPKNVNIVQEVNTPGFLDLVVNLYSLN